MSRISRVVNNALYNWTEDADRDWHQERIYQRLLLGETEEGDLLVPRHREPDWWQGFFNPRNPLHWPYWLVSRVTRKLVWLEVEVVDS